MTEKHDHINSPAHYTQGRQYEPVEVILDWQLDYLLGNVVKYVARYKRKPPTAHLQHIDDLKKAAYYLNKAIEKEQ